MIEEPTNRIAEAFGQWPGDETDEEIKAMLTEPMILSNEELILAKDALVFYAVHNHFPSNVMELASKIREYEASVLKPWSSTPKDEEVDHVDVENRITFMKSKSMPEESIGDTPSHELGGAREIRDAGSSGDFTEPDFTQAVLDMENICCEWLFKNRMELRPRIEEHLRIAYRRGGHAVRQCHNKIRNESLEDAAMIADGWDGYFSGIEISKGIRALKNQQSETKQ